MVLVFVSWDIGVTPKKVTIESLPEDKRPTQLVPLNKRLVDTVKMIAYRAETSLVGILLRQSHLKIGGRLPATGFTWSWPEDGRNALD